MEHLSELQSMFPSLDADVIAIILNQSKDNVETTVERLLEMSLEANDQSKPAYIATPPQPSTNSQSLHRWMTPDPQSFPSLPVYNQPPFMQQYQYQPPRPTPKSLLDTGDYDNDNLWPNIQPAVSLQHPTPKPVVSKRSCSPVEVVTSNRSFVTVPGRSKTVPSTMAAGGIPQQWLSPHPGIRSNGQVTGTNSTEYAQKPPPPPVMIGQRNIPRLQNRHIEVRNRFEPLQPRPQGSKVQDRSKPTEQKSASLQSVEKKLIIIRGLSGSGKSTLARSLVGQFGVICSTDDFFVVSGKYVFDPTALADNHEKNRVKARKSMASGRSPVVIDNTNANAWEMKPYVSMAIELGYDVEIVEPDTPWRFKVSELTKRNKHGVPRAAIERMLEKYEHRMSVERILTSDRPDKATPTNKTTPIEQSKNKERQVKKEVEKPKSPTVERWQKDKPTISSRGNKTHETKPKKMVSPKPPRKNEGNQQRNGRHTHESSTGKSGSHDNQQSRTNTNGKPNNSKKVNKTENPPPQKTKSAPTAAAHFTLDLEQSAKISLANVPSVAEIEADLLGDQWDSSEEMELLTDEDLNGSHDPSSLAKLVGNEKRKNVCKMDNKQTDKVVGISEQQPVSVSMETDASEQMMKNDGLVLMEKAWEMARKESTENDSTNLTAMFSQLQAPSTTDASVLSVTTPILDSAAVEEKNESMINEMQVGPVTIHLVPDNVRKTRGNLNILSAAFDSCKGWEEKYLLEATKDEAENPLNSFGNLVSSLHDNFTEGLIPNDAHLMLASFSDDKAPKMGVVRKSRMVDGLDLKQLPEDNSVEHSHSDPFLGALQESLMKSGWIDTIFPSDAVSRYVGGETVAAGDDDRSIIAGITVATEHLEAVIEKEESTEDVEGHLEDINGRQNLEEGNSSLVDEDVQPLNSDSLDAFLSSEESMESSREVASSSVMDSLEQELSNIVQNVDIFPSAFPVTSETNALLQNTDEQVEPSSDSFSPPPSPRPLEIYVSLGESICTSEEDEEKGINFSAFPPSEDILVLNNEEVDAMKTENVAIENSAKMDVSENGAALLATEVDLTEAAPEASVEDNDNGVQNKEENDLTFLIGCFPDLEPSYLQQLLTKCVDVESALSVALVSMTTPIPLDKPKKQFKEISKLRTPKKVKDDKKIEVESAECYNDEKIAQMLQEEMNGPVAEGNAKMADSSEGSAVSSTKSSPSSRDKIESNGDDNLVLTLSESFAKQLQTLYGSIEKHLPHEGEVQGDDLKVLLSETVAKGIYQMWVKTLQAKHIEYQVQAELLLKKDEALARSLLETEMIKHRVASEPLLVRDHTPRRHHHSLPLTRGQDETLPRDRRLTLEAMPAVTSNDLKVSQQLQLTELYTHFPGVNRSTICDVVMGTNFNYKDAAEKLEGLFPSAAGPTRHRSPTKLSSPRKVVGVASSRQEVVDFASVEEEDYQPSYDELRAEAALHAKLRAESFQKAAKAHGQKQYSLAQFYAQQGHLHTDKMKEANRRAAGHTLSKQTHSRNSRSITRLDLHGLHVSEALEALQEKLYTEKGVALEVVTGRGSHSEGQVARIKPAVISFLKRCNYKYEEVNAGMLKVKLL